MSRRPLLELLLAALLAATVNGFAPPSSRVSAHSHSHHVSPRPADASLLSAFPATEEPPSSSPPSKSYDAVIVGGGPAGLLSAIILARQFPPSSQIIVFDRLAPPPPPNSPIYAAAASRYYLLGLGHRGQSALRAFDAWSDVENASVAVLGRRDWAPGKSGEDESNIKLAEKAVTSRVLARDKLVGVLKGHIERRYGEQVELKYGYQADPMSFGNEHDILLERGPFFGRAWKNGAKTEGEGKDPPPVTLRMSRCVPVEPNGEAEECSVDGDGAPATITTQFLIGADGAARTIANRMEENDKERQRRRGMFANLSKRLFGGAYAIEPPFRVKRYVDDNPRVYKSVPISFPQHWPRDLNYSARSTDGRITFEALPSDDRGNYCALLLMRPDDPLAAVECDPKLLREFLEREFPQFSKLLQDIVVADVATKKASALPGFRYAGPRLHEGGRTVILGDCAHTVKPYFGLGANTALEDVQVLSEILSLAGEPPNLPAAVREFTKRRGADSKALVTISRNMDRPGKLGAARFVVPLILDSIFHKLAPKVFAPSMFGMFQKEGIGFRQIQRRKRLDRAMQSFVILSAISLVGMGVRYFVRSATKVLGIGEWIVGGGLAALLGAAGAARRFAKTEEG